MQTTAVNDCAPTGQPQAEVGEDCRDPLGDELTARGVGALHARLKDAIKTLSPKIIVIDSFKAIHDLAKSTNEMRLMLQRLRQHVVHFGRNEMELSAVLKKSISGTIALLRHTLLAFSDEPPVIPGEIFARIEGLTGADAAAFGTIYDYRETATWKEDSFAAYDKYLKALEKVIGALDSLVPKQEWQRVQK